MGVLVREVAALYAAFAAGRPSPLPELPVQYADFAVWQRSWLQGEVLESELAYWRAAARGPAAAPGAAHRPAAARGAELPRRLAAGAAAGRAHPAAGRLSRRREGATLFMMLLAGFQALLARYSGQDDLAVGSPDRRPQPGGDRGADRVLRQHPGAARRPVGRARASASCSAGCARRRWPPTRTRTCRSRSWSRSWRRSGASRHTPLFQVMLALQNAPVGAPGAPGPAPAAGRRGSGTTAKFDLTLSLAEHDGGLVGHGRVRHRPVRRHDRSTGCSASFERLLAAAVADAGAAVCRSCRC